MAQSLRSRPVKSNRSIRKLVILLGPTASLVCRIVRPAHVELLEDDPLRVCVQLRGQQEAVRQNVGQLVENTIALA